MDYKDGKNAVPFVSPPSMEITIHLPGGETVSGMGIKRGVTVITGDAYHGKSTILDAIQNGVFNHYKGDGREYVITDDSAQSIEAEDGRMIKNADISFFLTSLPVKGVDARSFSTQCASGSTSQAAAVYEALEAGCRLMLFDEDRSANNFMYKDEKMRAVIPNASTRPFIDNAQMLFREFGVSSIIVVGASGEYFKVADRVILVDRFVASEYTDYERRTSDGHKFVLTRGRVPDWARLLKAAQTRDISIPDGETVAFGGEKLKVTDVIPSPTRGQLVFIGSFLYCLAMYGQTGGSVAQAVNALYKKVDADLCVIRQDTIPGFSQLEHVRACDMLSLLNRCRAL